MSLGRKSVSPLVTKIQIDTVPDLWRLTLRTGWRPARRWTVSCTHHFPSLYSVGLDSHHSSPIGLLLGSENRRSGVKQKEAGHCSDPGPAVPRPWARRQLPGQGPQRAGDGAGSADTWGLAPSALSSMETPHPSPPGACPPQVLAASRPSGHDIKSNLHEGPGDPLNRPLRRSVLCFA